MAELAVGADPNPPPRGIPWWVVGIVAAVSFAETLAVGFFYLMLAAFACDSGWEGCAEISTTSMVIYAVLSLMIFIGCLLVGLLPKMTTRAGRIWRIVAIVVLPLGPLIGFAGGWAYLMVGALNSGA